MFSNNIHGIYSAAGHTAELLLTFIMSELRIEVKLLLTSPLENTMNLLKVDVCQPVTSATYVLELFFLAGLQVF